MKAVSINYEGTSNYSTVVNLKTGHIEDISCDTLVIPVSGAFVENYKGGSVDEIN